MARVARKRSKSGVYHIVLQGINKQTIFYDDEDNEILINKLKIVKEKDNYDILAFCLMSNHVHLLLGEKDKSISDIMRKILSSYVFWYNSKYERIGNLFQDRFNSEVIEDDSNLLCAARYIHENPIKAGIVSNIEDYKWSSYSAYLSDQENLVDTKKINSILQNKEEYIKFMAVHEEKQFLEHKENFRISDEKLIKEIKKKLNIVEMSEICKLSRTEFSAQIKQILEIKSCNPFQVSRVTGITMGIIRTILS